jgi:hypothetical protein
VETDVTDESIADVTQICGKLERIGRFIFQVFTVYIYNLPEAEHRLLVVSYLDLYTIGSQLESRL